MDQSKFASQTEPQMTKEGTDQRETRMSPAETEGWGGGTDYPGS